MTSSAYGVAVDRLVAARKQQNLSQRELAERLGKSRSFVEKIEVRQRRVDIVEFVAIARALGVEPTALLADIVSALPSKLDF